MARGVPADRAAVGEEAGGQQRHVLLHRSSLQIRTNALAALWKVKSSGRRAVSAMVDRKMTEREVLSRMLRSLKLLLLRNKSVTEVRDRAELEALLVRELQDTEAAMTLWQTAQISIHVQPFYELTRAVGAAEESSAGQDKEIQGGAAEVTDTFAIFESDKQDTRQIQERREWSHDASVLIHEFDDIRFVLDFESPVASESSVGRERRFGAHVKALRALEVVRLVTFVLQRFKMKSSQCSDTERYVELTEIHPCQADKESALVWSQISWTYADFVRGCFDKYVTCKIVPGDTVNVTIERMTRQLRWRSIDLSWQVRQMDCCVWCSGCAVRMILGSSVKTSGRWARCVRLHDDFARHMSSVVSNDDCRRSSHDHNCGGVACLSVRLWFDVRAGRRAPESCSESGAWLHRERTEEKSHFFFSLMTNEWHAINEKSRSRSVDVEKTTTSPGGLVPVTTAKRYAVSRQWVSQSVYCADLTRSWRDKRPLQLGE